MKKSNVILAKSIKFSLEIMEYTRFLKNDFNEYDLARQLFRSGTSIGANISEAQYASSKKDFINKLHIALKEANETWYWLNLAEKSNNFHHEKLSTLQMEIKEIKHILSKILTTTKKNLNANS